METEEQEGSGQEVGSGQEEDGEREEGSGDEREEAQGSGKSTFYLFKVICFLGAQKGDVDRSQFHDLKIHTSGVTGV